ncbi:hypothetical protein IV500_04465 [Paeniglutamicibacter antarcticus]|uniref:Uncharacterized protein n=1 Tax=Arthrobacter terrae TaxID=2935737 RepID=A0A931G6W1_9MICC|nr:hypothetical protein [Arthrobacter terrae]MBG0738674.1 hypothetical protein [Arthrobacter terrae]
MTSEGLNRQPQGITVGGQFAPTQHSEAPIRLFDRADGSFLNPAPSATADHCIQFWSRVEIPDEVIDQVADAYVKYRSEEIDRDLDQTMARWRANWEKQNPVPKDRHLPEYQQRFKQEYEQHRLSALPGVVAKRPERLGEYDTRQLIRAAKMLAHRPNSQRFPGEGDKVLNEPIELFDETLTVLEIDKKYSLWDVRYSMEKIFRNDAEALLRAVESQSEQLSGIHEQLVHQRSDFAQY